MFCALRLDIKPEECRAKNALLNSLVDEVVALKPCDSCLGRLEVLGRLHNGLCCDSRGSPRGWQYSSRSSNNLINIPFCLEIYGRDFHLLLQ